MEETLKIGGDMRQFDFNVNIEKRNPLTGNVYYISRMTSDWAERHPLNVDQFIEDVYREFEGTEFEESREELRRVWTAVLSVKRPQGDASLYPNNNGARRAAAMKVWLMAGDYWRRGFRTGDTLPRLVPGHTITRLPEGGWICLFPKEMHLLEAAPVIEPKNIQATNAPTIEPEPIEAPAPIEANATGEADDPRDAQISELQARIKELEAKTEPVMVEPNPEPVVVVAPRPTERERNASCCQQRRNECETQRQSYIERLERESREQEEYALQQERHKIFAAIGAAAVTLVLIYFFGLLGPAVFGLLAGGLLKG